MSSKKFRNTIKDRIDWVHCDRTVSCNPGALCLLHPDAGCIKERSRYDPFYPWRYLRPVLSCRRSLCLPAIPCIWHFPDSVRSASGNRMKSQNIPSSSGRGMMMFTSGLAADILFYSFCEWIPLRERSAYRRARFHADLVQHLPAVPLGSDPWAFYLVLAVSFGFMLHVRGCHKQKYSEACRALLPETR